MRQTDRQKTYRQTYRLRGRMPKKKVDREIISAVIGKKI